MTQKLTWQQALRRVAATAVQALAALVLALCALALSGDWNATAALTAALTAFLVPVATAVHRLAGVWLAQEEDAPAA